MRGQACPLEHTGGPSAGRPLPASGRVRAGRPRSQDPSHKTWLNCNSDPVIHCFFDLWLPTRAPDLQEIRPSFRLSGLGCRRRRAEDDGRVRNFGAFRHFTLHLIAASPVRPLPTPIAQDHFFVAIECQRPVRTCLSRGRRQLHEAQLGTQTRNVPQNGPPNRPPSLPCRTTE